MAGKNKKKKKNNPNQKKNTASRQVSSQSGSSKQKATSSQTASRSGSSKQTGQSGEWIRGSIRIELLSDLCVGSGYSHAGVIDSDICYDSYGIPYIPAKRLRGCLRETMESSLYTLFPDTADALFGKAGDADVQNLIIGNAYIPGYEVLKEQLEERKKHSSEPSFYDTQEILDRFTRVLGQTEIDEEGIADDTTLRYTRVVNQYSPLHTEQEPLVFVAEVLVRNRKLRVGEINFSCKYIVERCVQGTRHIGLKRNRGEGNVWCTWNEDARNTAHKKKSDATVSGRIRVRVHNVDPLMLSANQESVTESYISGQNLLGALAKKYLENPQNKPKDKAFRDLFLNGSTIYSNLYPAAGEMVFYPAPVYINRLKKTKKLVSVLSEELEGDKEDPASPYYTKNGNQPKKLKGKFVAFAEQDGQKTFAVHEVKKGIVYHHSHSKKNAEGEEGILYGMEVVSAAQDFEGFILVPKELAPLLMELLRSGHFYFGKSKSSQYGGCEVEADYIPQEESSKEIRADSRSNTSGAGDASMHKKDTSKEIPAGKHLVITFLSDTLLLSKERGEYTVYQDEIAQIIKDELGIKEKSDTNGEPGMQEQEDAGTYLSDIQTTSVSGYLGVWNLRRAAQPAVAAGSCLVYRLEKPFSTDRLFVGERNLEGYGQFRIDCAEDLPYQLTEVETNSAGTAEPAENTEAGKATVHVDDAFRNLMQEILVGTWLRQRIYTYLAAERKQRTISNSALGRITLMLKESLAENPTDDNAAFADLERRIRSIKTGSLQKEGEQILGLVGESGLGTWKLNFAQRRDENDTIWNEFSELGFAADTIKKMLNHTWGDYLMIVLREQKYMGGAK